MPRVSQAFRLELAAKVRDSEALFAAIQADHQGREFHLTPHMPASSDRERFVNHAVERGYLVIPKRRSEPWRLLASIYESRCRRDDRGCVIVRMRPDGYGAVEWNVPDAWRSGQRREREERDRGHWSGELNAVFWRLEQDELAARAFHRKLGPSLFCGSIAGGSAQFAPQYQEVITCVMRHMERMRAAWQAAPWGQDESEPGLLAIGAGSDATPESPGDSR